MRLRLFPNDGSNISDIILWYENMEFRWRIKFICRSACNELQKRIEVSPVIESRWRPRPFSTFIIIYSNSLTCKWNVSGYSCVRSFILHYFVTSNLSTFDFKNLINIKFTAVDVTKKLHFLQIDEFKLKRAKFYAKLKHSVNLQHWF